VTDHVKEPLACRQRPPDSANEWVPRARLSSGSAVHTDCIGKPPWEVRPWRSWRGASGGL